MGKQKRTVAWKKKQPSTTPEPIANTDALALDLVTRGLASTLILGYRGGSRRKP
jgi:hypothetical protein